MEYIVLAEYSAWINVSDTSMNPKLKNLKKKKNLSCNNYNYILLKYQRKYIPPNREIEALFGILIFD
jgi:hypothetical protein